MNRLFHLQQTYPQNIKNSESYSDREFVLLDYSSRDGVGDWVKENLGKEIEAGIVTFYQTHGYKYFFPAHAKNIAHKLATGDILFNLDVDNFIPVGMCEYIAKVFEEKNVLLVATESADRDGNHGNAGRIAALREHFYAVNGYDEDVRCGWGCDDTNYQERVLRHCNLKKIKSDPQFMGAIDHGIDVRVQNFPVKDIFLTEKLSWDVIYHKVKIGQLVANQQRHWGKAEVIKNFKEKVII